MILFYSMLLWNSMALIKSFYVNFMVTLYSSLLLGYELSIHSFLQYYIQFSVLGLVLDMEGTVLSKTDVVTLLSVLML